MHIHILGICGTFMGSLAQLAKQLGHRVTGSDANVYPPMSTQLEMAGIELYEGYDPAQLEPEPDLVVIGNAMSRGNPVVEAVLDRRLKYTSGPQWLCDHLLSERWVLAVAGTHGKTTTSSMLTWILHSAGMKPGYLIGGVPKNFSSSADLGDSIFFVVEADEYDSAFFDKRSKFVHYRPNTLILNNLEFDHADIFPDLAAIQTQFHHLVRTVPSNGLLISPSGNEALEAVVDRGCWTPRQTLSIDNADGDWSATLLAADGSAFRVSVAGEEPVEVRWGMLGVHNVENGLAAMAAARHVGVTPAVAAQALSEFQGVARRMDCLGCVGGVSVYDDFAHHPTAIATTLAGLRAKVGSEKILLLIEPRSNTMRMGVHADSLPNSVGDADRVFWYEPEGMNWNLSDQVVRGDCTAQVFSSLPELIEASIDQAEPGTHIVVMSNGGFGGVHQKLLAALRQRSQ